MSSCRAAPRGAVLRGALREAACVVALVSLATSASLTGCTAGERFVASPQEYAAYRVHRVEPSLEARLSGAAAYLKAYPDGVFADEVQAWLQRAEPIYFTAKQGSAAGLTAYLQALPDGVFAAQARRALARMESAQAPDVVASGVETEARIAGEQAARVRALREVETWLRRMMDPALWRAASMSQAPGEVLVPFSLALPWPVCRAIEEEVEAVGEEASRSAMGGAPPGDEAAWMRCAKLLSLPYVVPVEGGSEAREVTLEISVVQDAAGKPLSAAVSGPDLFLRLEEARAVRAFTAEDSTARTQGAALAATMAQEAFGARVNAAPACRKQAAAPMVLALGCAGVRVEVRPATEAGDDDRIVIAPLP
ncbi:hypothetical protein [Chondromyces apiculatus]|uniref:Uncharacterized protein n=1 Tax=Chondromyces apiculatus DSM 436 TaxID=1192034 RepID=A0A017TFE7_9BACT|nr:hypothetical protein [Chondromyces apiculatus]EYF08008.1 Hypothetical protein CAP_7030 [Chondromyces apiculatus DSM 436]